MTRLDNFVGGLIIGAIFSLLVNIFTLGIQESVQKQRVLEALESEILSNGLLANNTIKVNTAMLNDPNTELSPFHRTNTYATKVWDSSQALQYLLELDPLVQGRVTAFYSAIIGGANDLIANGSGMTKVKIMSCYNDRQKLTSAQQQDCISTYRTQITFEIHAAELVSEQTEVMLKEFHPTRDRLSNLFLKVLMGDKAVGALKIEPI